LKRYLPLVFIIVALVEGCAVKAPPIPPDVLVPKPISDLQGRVREGELYLRWSVPRENMDGSKPVDLVSFRILRRDEKGGCIECPGEFKVRADLDLRTKGEYRQERGIMSWKDKDLEKGILYVYKVTGINHWGYASPPSNEVVIQWGLPPPPPSSLNGEGRDGAIMLRWEPAEGATGYNIYRRQEDESFPLDPLNKTPVKGERYLDEGLQNEKKYHYVVRGVRVCGETPVEGKSSAQITAIPTDMTPPSPPIGLIAIPQEKGIELDWFPNEEPDLLGYSVYRQEIPGKNFHKITTETIEETRFLDLSAERGKSYHYAVTAIDNSPRRNESSLSRSVKIRY
jgi:fibronectin type 3 domain-containing protein